ncbi:hypothetical protein ACFVUY_29230 [Kitasatospora sp. NPDC058063]|uniref:hypothetical protein n=1 Tax=unclassified Kitasatospora TaxID=2633591 RepID=UPI0036D770AB
MNEGYVVMRTRADDDAPVLVYTQTEWDAWKAGAAAGEFSDLPEQTLPNNG